MTDNLESLLKALQVPSERVQVENKKDVDAFLKAFKKKKRLVFMKLNKNQITKNQVTSYYTNLINYLENYKKKRIENIITLTDELMQEFYTISENDVSSVDSGCGKKRPLSDSLNNVPKKAKLNAVAEDRISRSNGNDESLSIKMTTEQEELDILESDAQCLVISSTKRFTNDVVEEEENSIGTNETFEIVEKETVPEAKATSISENEDLEFRELKRDSDKVEKSIPNKLPFKRTFTSTTVPGVPSAKISELKTPLTKQNGLYKSTSSSSKTKISQTSSVQKKTAAEIRRLQDKREEERQQRIKEELQRKENQAKLANMRSAKNPLAASRLHLTGVPAKPLSVMPRTFPPKPIATNITKVNSLEKFPSTFTSALKPTVLPVKPTPSTGTVSKNKSSNISSIQDVNFAPEFKTPFAKKRVTLLSLSCRKIIENHESVDLADLRDVDTEDEDDECERRSKKPVPKWCNKTGGTLMNLIRYQSKHLHASTIFRNPASVPIDIETIFGRKGVVQNYLEEWKAF